MLEKIQQRSKIETCNDIVSGLFSRHWHYHFIIYVVSDIPATVAVPTKHCLGAATMLIKMVNGYHIHNPRVKALYVVVGVITASIVHKVFGQTSHGIIQQFLVIAIQSIHSHHFWNVDMPNGVHNAVMIVVSVIGKIIPDLYPMHEKNIFGNLLDAVCWIGILRCFAIC